jgi:hypothetical protein
MDEGENQVHVVNKHEKNIHFLVYYYTVVFLLLAGCGIKARGRGNVFCFALPPL